MTHVESTTFQGITFRRYPDSPHRSERVYFVPSGSHRAQGVGRLHEEVWKAEHGPIPPGHHVHHVDHDPLNNDPGNLVLMTAEEHRAHHEADPEHRAIVRSPEWAEHLDAIRPLAAAWHSTEDGRAWHREHGREVMDARPLLAATCVQCGRRFESKLPLRFCSNACKSAWRRAAGVDDEIRQCAWCGADFTANRYSRTRYCSRSHATKARAG